MGLTSDFFLASPDEMKKMDIYASPTASFHSVPAARIEVVKIAQLQCIIEGHPFETYLPLLDSMIVRGDDDGPWVIGIPDSIYLFLANPNSDIPSLAGKWAETEEWKLDGGTVDNLTPFLADLSLLAKTGKEKNLELYLWVSL